MIPYIVEINSYTQVESIIKEYADQFSIDNFHIMRTVPEKDELLVSQIKDVQSTLSTYQDKLRLITLEGIDNSSSEVQNALLKMLEETSDKIVFILPVVESQRILPTILSRCKFISKKTYDATSHPPLIPFLTLVDVKELRKNMNKTSAFSKEETLQCIEEIIGALPTHTNYASQKNIDYILKVRRLIMDNNVNHILGLDSILIFLSRQGTMKVTHET